MNYPDLPDDDPLLEPGAYDGHSKPWVRPDAYHASKRLSRSEIALLWPETGTPAEFLYRRENPVQATPAMVRGDAIHALALEPDRFAAEYAFPPPGLRRNRKDDKAAWIDFMLESGWSDDEDAPERFSPGPNALRIVGFTPHGAPMGKLFYDDVETVKATAEWLRDDKDLAKVLRSDGLTEASFAWDEEPIDSDGPALRFRIRPDRVNFAKTGTYLIDFKSSDEADPNGWRRKLERYRLYFQAAMYEHGFEEATGDHAEGFFHVVYRTKPPHIPAVYFVGQEYMEAGRAEFWAACRTLRECIASGDWPGYARHIVTMEPSPWFHKS